MELPGFPNIYQQQFSNVCERFELMSHFKSRLSLIVRCMTRIHFLQWKIKWLHVFVLFLAISCGHPGVPVHGKINSYVFSYNSSVEYSCNQGYTIVGPKKRVCQANQTWTGSLPQCIRKLFALTFTLDNKRGQRSFTSRKQKKCEDNEIGSPAQRLFC